MSAFYTNHLLKRYLSGDILAQEKITLKALLEPCILKNTADEQQRIVFSQLVRPSPAPSSCLQPSPAPSRRAPVRACNQPFDTLFVVPIGKTYNILSNDSKPNQPKTDNMHFTLTNFNGYKSDANKGFTKPRFETHESENAVSIVKECTNPCGATLYDMKTLWVCFYKMPPNIIFSNVCGLSRSPCIYSYDHLIYSARSDWSRHDEDVVGMDGIARTPI